MKRIESLHLFPLLAEELLKLLRSPDHSDWLKPSPVKGRTVKGLVSFYRPFLQIVSYGYLFKNN